VPEYEAFRQLHEAVTTPGTCSTGWNTRAFDNEILRFGFWRNFLPTYDHEWRNNCDAWDCIAMARAARALRPGEIEWPTREDGAPTFKLDRLAPANGFDHSNAHDALADVEATVHMARLMKTSAPKLWAWARKLADTDVVRGLVSTQPFLHSTQRISAIEFCVGVFGMAAFSPDRKNELIAWNLRENPEELLDVDIDTLRQRMFTKEEELPEGMRRLGVKKIKINRSPFVAPLSVLQEEDIDRLHINLDEIERHHQRLVQYRDVIGGKLKAAFDDTLAPLTDADDALYGGFAPHSDIALAAKVHDTPPPDLHTLERSFHDPRFKGLLLHYLARHHPDQLSDVQREQWVARTSARLLHPEVNNDLSWPDWQAAMQMALDEADDTLKDTLQQAADHGHTVAAAVGLNDSA
ncbi:MAG: exodeoxyribonuclease I, partial [Phycisphaerales bacterium]|nr:exodeoxyribonuclease I [Phycisphaerales bacterium]